MTDATDSITGLYLLYKQMIKDEGLEKVLWIRKYKRVVKIGLRKKNQEAYAR